MTKIGDMRREVPTSGSWMSQLEVDYVTDAVLNGWYEHRNDYIDRFEEAFAKFIGVRHAMTTSSCTGALHLSCKALGLGEGDEVLVPETTWIATASCACYVGAKPVFCDVDRETWCISPESVRANITARTKAIIPVDCYGHPCDMDALLAIAQEHNLVILEDAAPAIGSLCHGKRPGSQARVAAFSFQGAKLMVTGEGGMVVTDDGELMERIRFWGDHGRDTTPGKVLFNVAIGHKYKMSNIQAALGLAQLERLQELVDKKRQIFSWYRERLGHVDGLALNAEGEGIYNNFCYSSLALRRRFAVTADELRAELKRRGVDTRPFFHPISSFPMFESRREQNPVAYELERTAINLPCALNAIEEDIDHVCRNILEILRA